MADDRRVAIVPLPIVRDRTLSDHAKLIAVAIGTFMRSDGTCHPGIDAIAAERGCSARHAQRGINELAARLHLTVQHRQRQTAVLQWLHPLTGHIGVRSNPILTGQKTGLDRTKSGALRVFDRTSPLTATARVQNEVLNEVERGEKPVHSERSNRKQHVAELPVHDLTTRERPATPTPIAGALTRFLRRPGS